MFDYPDVKRSSAHDLRKSIEKAKKYWTFLWELKKLWTGFGRRAFALLNAYRPFQTHAEMRAMLATADDWSALKTSDIEDELIKCDRWLADAYFALGLTPEPAPADETAELDKRLFPDAS